MVIFGENVEKMHEIGLDKKRDYIFIISKQAL